jgi:hypothetical protein
MTKDIDIVQPSVVRAPARHRGPLSSEDYNNFQDGVYSDVISMSNAINSINNKLKNSLLHMEAENRFLKRKLESVEQSINYQEYTGGKNSLRVSRFIDFHNTKGILFPTTLDESKRAVFKSQFGEIFLPPNGVENKFFNFSLRTGAIVLPDDLVVDVTSQFDKLDGNGTVDFEHGGTVIEGKADNAFNGINESSWVRRVSFSLESDVEEVEVQLTAVVPSGISSQANLVEIITAPEGSVDITEISTSSSLSTAFTVLDNFTENNNATATRYHFSPRNVQQIRVRLRCRNWMEVNGKKVFMYGLQELGLKLVDYDKTYQDSDTFGQNITSIIKIDAPRDHAFNFLYRIDPDPNFFLEDASSRHVNLRLSSTPDFNGLLWDSTLDVPPQLGISTGVDLQGNTTIYAIYTFKFVAGSGGLKSPFPIGTTPTAKGLGLEFNLIQKASV